MVAATDCLALWVRLSGAERGFDCVSQTASGGQAIAASRPFPPGDPRRDSQLFLRVDCLVVEAYRVWLVALLLLVCTREAFECWCTKPVLQFCLLVVVSCLSVLRLLFLLLADEQNSFLQMTEGDVLMASCCLFCSCCSFPFVLLVGFLFGRSLPF